MAWAQQAIISASGKQERLRQNSFLSQYQLCPFQIVASITSTYNMPHPRQGPRSPKFGMDLGDSASHQGEGALLAEETGQAKGEGGKTLVGSWSRSSWEAGSRPGSRV